MKSIFQIPDYTGTLVTLGEREWKEKIISPAPTGHPEVEEYLDEIKATISDPDIVFESNIRSDTHIFAVSMLGALNIRLNISPLSSSMFKSLRESAVMSARRI